MALNPDISTEIYGDEQKVPGRLRKFAYRKIMGSVLRRGGYEPQDIYGFLSGSIIGSRICYPDQSIGGALVYKESWNQNWLGFDFDRAFVFPSARGPVIDFAEGGLRAIMLDEIANNPAHLETPVGLLDPLDLSHVLKEASYSPDALVEQGMLMPMTHAEAFDEVGMAHYIDDLHARGVADEPVYQVTPKGNTLVSLDTADSIATRNSGGSNWLRKLVPVDNLS